MSVKNPLDVELNLITKVAETKGLSDQRLRLIMSKMFRINQLVQRTVEVMLVTNQNFLDMIMMRLFLS